MQDKSLDHLIYDGMGQSLTDHRKGTQKIIGSVRPTTEEIKMKFVVNLVMHKEHPFVARSIGRNTMEGAIEVAIEVAMSELAKKRDVGDGEEQVREELTMDGYYIPTRHANWSVCINEVMDKMED